MHKLHKNLMLNKILQNFRKTSTPQGKSDLRNLSDKIPLLNSIIR